MVVIAITKWEILLSRSTWGRQRKPLYCIDDFEGVTLRPLDAEKLSTLRERALTILF